MQRDRNERSRCRGATEERRDGDAHRRNKSEYACRFFLPEKAMPAHRIAMRNIKDVLHLKLGGLAVALEELELGNLLARKKGFT